MTEIYKPQGILRFLLAMLVLWGHSLGYFFPEAAGWVAVLQLGNIAVASFFVLSGYLMFEAGQAWYLGRPGAFLLNRYLRIMPPFMMAAIVSILIHFGFLIGAGSVAGIDEIPEHAVGVNNALQAVVAPFFPFQGVFIRLLALAEPTYQFVRFSWAIFTELIFYWGLFLYLLLCRFLPRRLVNAAALTGSLVLAAVGFVFYNGAMLALPPSLTELASRIPYAMHLQWAPHFILGVLISVLSRRVSMLSLALAVLALAAALLQLGTYALHGITNSSVMLGEYLLLIGLIVFISRLTPEKIVASRLFSRRLDRSFGDLSYPIYINQYSLSVAFVSFCMVAGWTMNGMTLPLRMIMFALYNVFVIAASFLLIRLTDYFTQSLRQRVRGGAI